MTRRLTFREHKHRIAKEAALRAEDQGKAKLAADLWFEAANYATKPKAHRYCHDRYVAALNAYNAKFKPFGR